MNQEREAQLILSPESPKPQSAKTPRMRQVEQKFAHEGETIGQLLARLYQEENLSFEEMSRRFAESGLRVHSNTLLRWTRALNPQIKIKDLAEWRQDPQVKQYRISQIRAFWQDPEKKKRVIEERNKHPGYINRRRLSSSPKWLAEIHKGSAKTWRRKALQNRRTTLGRAPRKALRHMAQDEGLSASEIAVKIGRSKSTVWTWLKEYKIEPRHKPPERHKRWKITDDEIKQRREKIKRAQAANRFKYLTPRQQEVLSALYPEQGAMPTQATVARNLGVTRADIDRIEKRGLAKLEKLLADGPNSLKSKRQNQHRGISAQTLPDLHHNQGLTEDEITEKLRVRAATILRLMNELKNSGKKG